MADTRRYPSVPPLTLGADLASSSTTLKTLSAVDWDGNALASASFNTDYIPATLVNDARTKIEFILIDATTIGNLTTTGATIYKRGLPFHATGNDATDETEDSDRKEEWTQGETKVLIGTNPPWMYGQFANRKNDETIEGLWTLPNNANYPKVGTSYVAPTDDLHIATKKYADDLAIAGAPDSTESVKGLVEVATEAELKAGTADGGGDTSAPLVVTAAKFLTAWDMQVTTDYTYGATISVGDVLYLDTSDAKWKLADGSAEATADGILGIALDAGVDTNTGKRVQVGGVVTGLSGLTAGWQFISDTAGTLSDSAGTYRRIVGYAPDATSLILNHAISAAELTGGNSDLTVANLNEAATFFENTNLSGAEAETLSDGSNADSLHIHEDLLHSIHISRSIDLNISGGGTIDDAPFGYDDENGIIATLAEKEDDTAFVCGYELLSLGVSLYEKHYNEVGSLTSVTLNGVLHIGSDTWISNSADSEVLKNGAAVTISGTGRFGPLAVDPTNDHLLVLYGTTSVAKFSGIAGTTITNENDDITLDTAIDTDIGFMWDDTNSRLIGVDTVNNVIRRFDSSGTTIDTVAYTVPESSPETSQEYIRGVCFINDRVYLILSQWTPGANDPTTFNHTFIPTSMTR